MSGSRIKGPFPRALAAIAAALALAWLPALQAQPERAAAPSATELKAAFLYKFASYVEWPLMSTPGPGAPLVIGVIGSEPLIRVLAEITAGRSVNDHPIEIRRLGPNDLLDGVQILFIGDQRDRDLAPLLQLAGQQPILTVTESKGAIEDGSIINFTVERDRVRFEVSLPAAESSRLRLSSRLLAVASRVHRD